MRKPIQSIADEFAHMHDELDNLNKQFIRVDDELFERLSISHFTKQSVLYCGGVYPYTRDIRKETRMYLRNHVY